MATKKKSADDSQSSKSDLGASEVQKNMDEEHDQGFQGTKVDPTPDENYSMLTPGDAPTPETDPKMAAKAREATGLGITGIEAQNKK